MHVSVFDVEMRGIEVRGVEVRGVEVVNRREGNEVLDAAWGCDGSVGSQRAGACGPQGTAREGREKQQNALGKEVCTTCAHCRRRLGLPWFWGTQVHLLHRKYRELESGHA